MLLLVEFEYFENHLADTDTGHGLLCVVRKVRDARTWLVKCSACEAQWSLHFSSSHHSVHFT